MIIELSEQARIDLLKPPYDTEGLTCVILGNKGAGKSNTMAVFAEEYHRNQVPFIYYDPNGDAVSLRELGEDVVTIGDPKHMEEIRRADYPLEVAFEEAKEFIGMVLKDGYSLVVDLSEQDGGVHPLEVFTGLINQHFELSSRLRVPCGIFVDEAHMVAPQSGANKLEQLSRRAIRKVSSDGRKRGMGLVSATQHATYLDKHLIRGANVRIFGKCTYFPDYEAIQHYTPARFAQMQGLRSGEVFIVSEKAWGLTRIRKRVTTDLGKTPVPKPQARHRPSKTKQLQFSMEGL